MNEILENGKLRIEIAEKGAELVRIYDCEKGREILWDADPAFWGRHAPLLFPNVGRHFGDAFRVDGEAYPSHQHGFVRDMAFACVSKTDTSVTQELNSNDETRKVYPFDFRLRVTHTLDDRTLAIAWEVQNTGDKTMYFAIGGHPAFAIPAESYSQHQLYFEGKSELTYLLIDPNGSGTLLADEPHKLVLQEGKYSLDKLLDGDQVLDEYLFAKDALVFDGGQFDKVSILEPDGQPLVAFRAEGFPNFGIWAAPHAPFVCLEPWAGRTDDYGFEGELKDKEFINVLDSGQVFRKKYEIEVCE